MAVKPERDTRSPSDAADDDLDRLRALVSGMISGPESLYLREAASLARSKPEAGRRLVSLVARYHRLGQMPVAQYVRIRRQLKASLDLVNPATGARAPRVAHQGAAGDAAANEPRAVTSTGVPIEATVTTPLPDAATKPARGASDRESRSPPQGLRPPQGVSKSSRGAAAPKGAPQASRKVASQTAVPQGAASQPRAAPRSVSPSATPTPTRQATPELDFLPPQSKDRAPAAQSAQPHPGRPPAPLPGPAPALSGTSSPPSATAPRIEIGAVLRERYELQSLLGSGGMATVYKALDRYRASLGLPNCHVALKIVVPQSTDEIPDQTRDEPPDAALGREFHNAQQLSHPNIVNVFDIGHEAGATFYTMELLEGEQLDELMARIGGPLPREQALAIVRDIGSAIEHAHSRGILHADLKPQNVFVTCDGQVRILDFGGLSMPPRGPWIGELNDPQATERYRTAAVR